MKLKRILAVLSAITMIGASLTACSSDAESPKETSASESTSTTEITEAETTEETTSVETAAETTVASETDGRDLEVDRGILTTTITIPADFIDDLDSTIAEAEANEAVVEYTVNDDGSITYVYESGAYKEMLSEMRNGFDTTASEMLSSGSYQAITNIVGDSDLKNVNITVSSQQDYENSMDGLAMLGLYMYTGYYQVFCGASDNYSTTFHIIDAATGTEFSTVTYPDDIGN